MDYDVIIIGSGPAGLAAATLIAGKGGKVLLLDEQLRPGGQIYRNVENTSMNLRKILGSDYACGEALVKKMRQQSVDYIPGAVVWQVTEGREVGYSVNGKSSLVRAPWVIIATGATERPFPIPGWTLPGVMMAGAAQTLLKSSGLAADGAVFAGCGPLLYLVASQYLSAGVKIAALLDTGAKPNYLAALPYFSGALKRWDMLAKGMKWISDIRRSETRVIKRVSELRIEGKEEATGVSYRTYSGAAGQIETKNIFLHHGVVPNVNLAMAANVEHLWSDEQICWYPRVDSWGCTNVDGLLIAGDGAGISGGLAAEAAGRLAALWCLKELGKIDPTECDSLARAQISALKHETRIRPFLDNWFKPPESFRVPDGDTIVCRCEELTAKDISDVIDIGVAGPNQLKSFSRAGMGPCQGRYCGLTVQELIAKKTGRKMSDIGYYRLRPPIKPISLGEFAEMDAGPPANES